MKYLIDTHVLLWMLGDDQNLSAKSRAILKDESNSLLVSLMTFWEIAIKHSSGKLEIDISIQDLLQFSIENKIDILPVVFADIAEIDRLSFPKINGAEHRDPFDRMLIGQSITNNLPLISCDEKFDLYPSLKRIW